MTLEQNTTYNGLIVCKHCGWPLAGARETDLHKEDCPHEKAGASAAALADRFPTIKSTKSGYGTGRLTFIIDKRMLVQFECSSKGTFQLHDVFCLRDLSANEAASLVKALEAWSVERLRLQKGIK
jgi:hypothetical protein